MVSRQANSAPFRLFVDSASSSLFQVLSFTGTDRISQPYRFDVTARSSDLELDPADYVTRRVSLLMARGQGYCPYSGIITRFALLDTARGFATYHVRFRSSLWMLRHTVRSRVFLRQNIVDIVKGVLEEAGLSRTVEYDLGGNYPVREQVVQYQESDLAFVSRLLESHGIWYLFRENELTSEEADGSPVQETLVISDRPESFEDIKGQVQLPYRPVSGLVEQRNDADTESVDQLTVAQWASSREVLVRGYNYRTPQNPLSASTQVSGGHAGTRYRYGGTLMDNEGAQAMSSVLARRLSARTRLGARSNCAAIRAAPASAFRTTDAKRSM